MGLNPGGLDLKAILAEPIDHSFKGFPDTAGQVLVGTIGEERWNALDGDLGFPLLLVKHSSVDHNIRLLAAYAEQHGASLAPHAKTAMAPQLVSRQLAAGAWAVTVATIAQARILRSVGVKRLLIANQVLDARDLSWLVSEMNRSADVWFCVLVDSIALVRRMNTALTATPPRRPLPVLIEVGLPNGRCGCRSLHEVLATAEAILAASTLKLVGVEGYEGMAQGDTVEAQITAVDAFLGVIRSATEKLATDGYFDDLDEVIVSAGGSLFFDRVLAVLGGSWSVGLPVRVVLRSGAYVTHDSGHYEALSPLAGRGATSERLRPALELWAVIISRPEPELAIAGFGKRDASFDRGLPVALVRHRDGIIMSLAPGLVEVTSLNDQHARLRISPQSDLAVGDLVGFGVSHPCTAFDRWRLLPEVTDSYQVIGAIATFF